MGEKLKELFLKPLFLVLEYDKIKDQFYIHNRGKEIHIYSDTISELGIKLEQLFKENIKGEI